jgi:Cu+-exporting ATPase
VLAPHGEHGDPGDHGEGSTHDHDTEPIAALRNRLLVSTVLAVPVVVLAMVPPLQFRNWQWLSFALAGPVVVWGGWPFHRAAWVNLRHGAATMDTLISVGTLAAFGWSVYALFWGGAGEPGMTMSFSFDVARLGRTRSSRVRRRSRLHPRRPLLRPREARSGARPR